MKEGKRLCIPKCGIDPFAQPSWRRCRTRRGIGRAKPLSAALGNVVSHRRRGIQGLRPWRPSSVTSWDAPRSDITPNRERAQQCEPRGEVVRIFASPNIPITPNLAGAYGMRPYGFGVTLIGRQVGCGTHKLWEPNSACAELWEILLLANREHKTPLLRLGAVLPL